MFNPLGVRALSGNLLIWEAQSGRRHEEANFDTFKLEKATWPNLTQFLWPMSLESGLKENFRKNKNKNKHVRLVSNTLLPGYLGCMWPSLHGTNEHQRGHFSPAMAWQLYLFCVYIMCVRYMYTFTAFTVSEIRVSFSDGDIMWFYSYHRREVLAMNSRISL